MRPGGIGRRGASFASNAAASWLASSHVVPDGEEAHGGCRVTSLLPRPRVERLGHRGRGLLVQDAGPGQWRAGAGRAGAQLVAIGARRPGRGRQVRDGRRRARAPYSAERLLAPPPGYHAGRRPPAAALGACECLRVESPRHRVAPSRRDLAGEASARHDSCRAAHPQVHGGEEAGCRAPDKRRQSSSVASSARGSTGESVAVSGEHTGDQKAAASLRGWTIGQHL